MQNREITSIIIVYSGLPETGVTFHFCGRTLQLYGFHIPFYGRHLQLHGCHLRFHGCLLFYRCKVKFIVNTFSFRDANFLFWNSISLMWSPLSISFSVCRVLDVIFDGFAYCSQQSSTIQIFFCTGGRIRKDELQYSGLCRIMKDNLSWIYTVQKNIKIFCSSLHSMQAE